MKKRRDVRWLWAAKWEVLAGFTMLFGLVAPRIYKSERTRRIGLGIHAFGLAAILHIVWGAAYSYVANSSSYFQLGTAIFISMGLWVGTLMFLLTVIPAALSFWLFKSELTSDQKRRSNFLANGASD